MRRIVAVFRFLLPDAWIRLAEEEGFSDKEDPALHPGQNAAAFSGDMLTTAGITIERDMQMLGELGLLYGIVRNKETLEIEEKWK